MSNDTKSWIWGLVTGVLFSFLPMIAVDYMSRNNPIPTTLLRGGDVQIIHQKYGSPTVNELQFVINSVRKPDYFVEAKLTITDGKRIVLEDEYGTEYNLTAKALSFHVKQMLNRMANEQLMERWEQENPKGTK